MSDHPSTFDATPVNSDEDAWDDAAALHEADDGQGVLDSAKALRRGSFADMIRYLTRLPEEEREKYVIQKAGDRQYTADEAEGLAARPDFPKS
ncbi:hypothetical protein F7D01_00505 [Erythrobacter sp. 3-20A1M]|uniref:hypothetical protein n=1 Tax=Erythrobacter sp. 3-20A1M TaxID=2653850 RepID=UPI001BFC4CDE|nr:hypothetical protein [Erythrobacter sp. 3-20A1M]QWC55765.1 hypothetical protein F7D01_00505 [Erythrobacter sp. 3-20A1M]